MITFNHVIILNLPVLKAGGHLPSRFNRDKARPYVGALSVLITCGICHFFTLFKIFPRKQYADLVLRLEER
jgi:hypothetical protein